VQQHQLLPMFQTLICKLKATFESSQEEFPEKTEALVKKLWIGMLNCLSMSGGNQALKL
jgi:hypothetical protein